MNTIIIEIMDEHIKKLEDLTDIKLIDENGNYDDEMISEAIQMLIDNEW